MKKYEEELYICDKCGDVFETPDYEPEYICEGLTENSPVCPNCGYESITKAAICEKCGNAVFEDDIEDGLCCACADRVKSKFAKFVSELEKCEKEYILEYVGNWAEDM